MLLAVIVLLAVFSMKNVSGDLNTAEPDVLVLAIATEENCQFKKFRRSLIDNDISFQVLGMGQQWRGFGQKIDLLKQEIEAYKDDESKIILVTDSYDVLFNGGVDQILEKFKLFDAGILFSAEWNCWPDEHLCAKVPSITEGKNLLNSGLFIGYASVIYGALISFPFHSELEHDQRYFYQVYVDEEKRNELKVKLDHRCELFQTMEGDANNVELRFEGEKSFFHNKDFKTRPIIIHTPGHCKNLFNILSNFIPQTGESDDCLNEIDLSKMDRRHYPGIVIAVLVNKINSKLGDYLQRIYDLNYPKEKIHLYFRCKEGSFACQIAERFIERHGAEYDQFNINNFNETKTLTLQEMGFDAFLEGKRSYYFNVNSISKIKDPNIIQHLIEQKFSPQLISEEAKSSTFMFFLLRDDHCRNSFEIRSNKDTYVLGMY